MPASDEANRNAANDDNTRAAASLASVGQDEAPPLPAHLEKLADRARDYVEAASSANTRRAYASDWKQFGAWCRRQGLDRLVADPQVVGLYITAQASGAASVCGKPSAVSTIERRLSSLSWHYAQRGTLSLADRQAYSHGALSH